jgi:hypothetical protein
LRTQWGPIRILHVFPREKSLNRVFFVVEDAAATLNPAFFVVRYSSPVPLTPRFLSFASNAEGHFSRFFAFRIPWPALAIISGMETTIPKPTPGDDGEPEVSSVKISRDTRNEFSRLAHHLKPASSDALVRFLIRHFDESTHLNNFFDLRELCALTDRLHTVLLFVATTNLELGQHLRRTEAGHYRRLVQYGDELVALHNRMSAESDPARLAAKE